MVDQVLEAVQVQGTAPSYSLRKGPYGSERVPVLDPAEPSAPAVSVQDGSKTVLVNDDYVQGSPGWDVARAAREQRALKPDSGILEGIGAAIKTWDTTRLYDRITRPEFENDTPINQHEWLNEIGIALSADERDWFLSVGKGEQSAAWAMDYIKDRRQAHEVLGDHPVVGFATMFLDPVWLAVPPALRLGKAAPLAGRAVAGVSGAGIAGGITASGEGPVSDTEIALSMLMNGAASAALYRPGQGIVKADPAFPDAELNTTVKAAEAESSGVRTGTFQAPTSAEGAVKFVDEKLNADTTKRGLGDAMQWNIHKSMASFGPAGRRVADLLFDNNSDLSVHSMEAQRESILSNLKEHQIRYEDGLRSFLAAEGYGDISRFNPFRSRDAYHAQAQIEKAIQLEMFRREQFTRQGLPIDNTGVDPRIVKMADDLDTLHKVALKEMQAAGVEGAENLLERPGYLNRKWSSQAIDNVLARLEATGLTREAAHRKLTGLVGMSIRRANANMDKDIANQIGQAIVDRALRKGYFEDSLFNAPAGEGQLKQLRDILKQGGMQHQEIERALSVLRVQSDDAGKAGMLKHRMDLDYKAIMQVNGETISVTDLIDGRVTSIVDQYIKQVSTSAAFARKGLTKRSDIEALRTEFLHDIADPAQRSKAKEMFDNSIAYLRGEPAGASMNENFRLMQQYGRMISLPWSGLWQATEYANIMAKYGLGKTLKYAMQEFPGFKKLVQNPSMDEARTLNTVLANHSVESLRLRPYLARYEDGYDMDMGSALQLSAQQGGNMVPYANGMKYVHHHQAKILGNLILDRVDSAAKGNAKAIKALQEFGIEGHLMDKLGQEIKKHGFKVDDWDDAVWQATRPAFAKMMDSAVLRGRLGDMPAFAMFDSVGKFLFTYRTFVLIAHNKVLAGNMERNGAGAVGLLMLYQFPLAMAAVQAQSVINGKGTLDTDDLLAKSIGQMGGLGLFSEPFRWATGESNSVGTPGLIPLDRGVKLFQNVMNGDAQQGASTAMTMMPVATSVPFIRGMANQIKED